MIHINPLHPLSPLDGLQQNPFCLPITPGGAPQEAPLEKVNRLRTELALAKAELDRLESEIAEFREGTKEDAD